MKKNVGKPTKFERKVAYYHGCYVNYNNPQLGKEFIQVFNAMDIGVVLLEKKMLRLAIKRKTNSQNVRRKSLNLTPITSVKWWMKMA